MTDLMKLFHFKTEMYLEVDLETYQDPIMLNNLIGSVKGYVGYEQGGLLSEHLIRYPMAFVYFRHFDQAHMSIQQFLYQLFKKETFLDDKGFIHSAHHASPFQFPRLKTLPTVNHEHPSFSLFQKQSIQIVNFQDIPQHKKEEVFCESLLLEKGKYYYNPQTGQLETRNKTR